MAIHVVCPQCSSPFVLGDEYAGQSFICSHCETAIPLPEPAPQPLPAIRPEEIRRVTGARRPFIFQLLGVETLPEDLEEGPLLSAWKLRYLFVLLSLLVVTAIFAGTAESAQYFGPVFFVATAILLLIGYLASVRIGQYEIGNASEVGLIARYLIQPLILPFVDARAALPALRIYFFTFILAGGTLLMGLRAGSIASVLPHAPRPVSASADTASPPAPVAPRPARTGPLVFNPDVVLKDLPASTPAPADSPTTLPAPSTEPPSPASSTSPPPLDTTTTPPPPPDNNPPSPATTTPAVSQPVTDQAPPPPPAE